MYILTEETINKPISEEILLYLNTVDNLNNVDFSRINNNNNNQLNNNNNNNNLIYTPEEMNSFLSNYSFFISTTNTYSLPSLSINTIINNNKINTNNQLNNNNNNNQLNNNNNNKINTNNNNLLNNNKYFT